MNETEHVVCDAPLVRDASRGDVVRLFPGTLAAVQKLGLSATAQLCTSVNWDITTPLIFEPCRREIELLLGYCCDGSKWRVEDIFRNRQTQH